MLPHPGVHSRTENQRLVGVPGAGDAREYIVANAAGQLTQGVGVQRGDQKQISPLGEVDVQHRVASALPGGPLDRVREHLTSGR